MKLVEIDKIPRARKKRLQGIIEDFVDSQVPRVEVTYTPGEYAHSHSCYSSFYKAARLSGHDIYVTTVGNKIFMENRALNRKKR